MAFMISSFMLMGFRWRARIDSVSLSGECSSRQLKTSSVSMRVRVRVCVMHVLEPNATMALHSAWQRKVQERFVISHNKVRFSLFRPLVAHSGSLVYRIAHRFLKLAHAQTHERSHRRRSYVSFLAVHERITHFSVIKVSPRASDRSERRIYSPEHNAESAHNTYKRKQKRVR